MKFANYAYRLPRYQGIVYGKPVNQGINKWKVPVASCAVKLQLITVKARDLPEQPSV